MRKTVSFSQISDFVSNVAVLIYQLLFLLMLINSHIVKEVFILGYCLFLSLIFINYYRKDITILLIFLFFSFLAIICAIFRQDSYSIYAFIAYFFFQFIIVFLYLKKNISNVTTYICMGCYLTYVLFRLLQGTYVHEILDSRSGNMVGFYFLCYVILYHILQIKNNKEYSMLPSAILVLLSIAMQGRAGIITSFLLFLGLLYNKVKYKKWGIKLCVILFVVSIGVFLYWEFEDFWLISLDKLLHQQTSLSGREDIWAKYFLHLKNDIETIFIGVSSDSDTVFLKYDKNFHNSILSAHSYWGVTVLLLFLFILLNMYGRKKNKLVSFLLFILFIRSFSDSVLFINFNDYLVFVAIGVVSPNFLIHRKI